MPPAYYGFILCLAGLVLSFGGLQSFRVLLPALIYLAFAVPLPRLIEVALTAKMQLLSSTLGVIILQFLGISVFQDGNIIDLGQAKLQVVEACSGLRYLFPLMSLGFLIAFLFNGTFWKRALIFLSTIPLTLGMNSLRIAVTGILVNIFGPGAAEGIMHDAEGFFVFGLCLALLFIEVWLLSRSKNKPCGINFDYLRIPSGNIFGGKPAVATPALATVVLSLLMACVLLVANPDNRENQIPNRESFHSFPLSLEQWEGHTIAMAPDLVKTLGATDYWNASYTRSNIPGNVDLFIAYYDEQRTGNSAHSPANCIPGSGWNIVSREIVPVELKNMTFGVTRMRIRKGPQALLVYYWFDQRGRLINEQYSAKWFLLVDAILKKRTDGAVIRLITPILEQEGKDAADQRLVDFIRDIYPVTKKYIPN